MHCSAALSPRLAAVIGVAAHIAYAAPYEPLHFPHIQRDTTTTTGTTSTSSSSTSTTSTSTSSSATTSTETTSSASTSTTASATSSVTSSGSETTTSSATSSSSASASSSASSSGSASSTSSTSSTISSSATSSSASASASASATSSHSSSYDRVGAIVGISIGIAIAALLVLFLCMNRLKQRRLRKKRPRGTMIFDPNVFGKAGAQSSEAVPLTESVSFEPGEAAAAAADPDVSAMPSIGSSLGMGNVFQSQSGEDSDRTVNRTSSTATSHHPSGYAPASTEDPDDMIRIPQLQAVPETTSDHGHDRSMLHNPHSVEGGDYDEYSPQLATTGAQQLNVPSRMSMPFDQDFSIYSPTPHAPVPHYMLESHALTAFEAEAMATPKNEQPAYREAR